MNEATKLGLNINYAKTKIMIVSESTPPQSIEINNHIVEVVDNFIYLGSKISRRDGIQHETSRRIALASDVFRKALATTLEAQEHQDPHKDENLQRLCTLSSTIWIRNLATFRLPREKTSQFRNPSPTSSPGHQVAGPGNQ